MLQVGKPFVFRCTQHRTGHLVAIRTKCYNQSTHTPHVMTCILEELNRRDKQKLYVVRYKEDVMNAYGCEIAELVQDEYLAKSLLHLYKHYVQQRVTSLEDIMLLRTYISNIYKLNRTMPTEIHEVLVNILKGNAAL
jgi:hypothetical protein